MKKSTKHPEDMTAAELTEATREFDHPFAFTNARPMTAAERLEERHLRRGRPRIGKGAKKISISLEGNLLRRADALAKKRGLNRSELISSILLAGMESQPV
jgi:hypothetical protein